jgi:hypothetical protein
MPIYNNKQKIDIFIHATPMTASRSTAENKSVNPHIAKSDKGGVNSNDIESGGMSRALSGKRKIHLVQNAGRFAVNLGINVIPNAVNGQIANATGDTNYQAYARRQSEIKADVVNPITNISNATISGALIYGPVGAIMGLVTSATSSIFSLVNKYEGRNTQYAIDVWKQNQSTNYNKARAGIDLTDGRTRLR